MVSDTPKGFTYCQKIQSEEACENAYLWQEFNQNRSGGGTVKPCHWHGNYCDTHKDERDWVHSCPVDPASLMCVQPTERSWGAEPWAMSNEDVQDSQNPSFDKTDSFNVGTSEGLPWKSNHALDSDGAVTIECEGKNLSMPGNALVLTNPANGKKAMWCPNAKIGTSTMSAAIATIFLGKTIDEYNNVKGRHTFVRAAVKKVTDFKNGMEKQLCNMDISFTFIRNPWDRLISAYLDKVATRKIVVPGFYNATFPQLLYSLKEVHPGQMNGHFMPVSSRCLTGIANYTKVYKIEHDFEHSIADIFSTLGVSRHRTLNVLKKMGARNQNSQHHRGLRDRQEMFHVSNGLANLVARLYADDIAFGRYSFDKTG